MTPKPSRRIAQMAASATFAMAARAQALREQGKSIINLSVGEPDFNTPDFVGEAAKKAIDDHYDHYPPVSGYPALREAIAHKFKRDNGLEYELEQIVVSTGAKQALMNACLCILNPGDEAIVPAPYWVSYLEMVHLSEGVPVIVPAGLEDDFKIKPPQLEEALSDKTRLLFFNSPCNPSGSVYTREELVALVAVLTRYPEVVVLSDEIYEYINYSGQHQSLAQFPEIYDRVVTLNGLSKAFAMTGWRIGYMGAPEWIAKACTKLQGQFTSGANSIAQRAAISALEATPRDIRYRLDAFKRRRDRVVERIHEISAFQTNVPEGAFYIFPDVSACFGKTYGGQRLEKASNLSRYLLEYAGVATVTGEAFGAPQCLRFSYAVAEDNLDEAFERIRKALR